MYFFVNDYNSIAHKEILDALYDAIDEKNVGYGFDIHSENARNLIKKSLDDENVDIHFIPGGTSANILGVACGMRQQDSVIAAKSGHIMGHEAGSIEATGIKIEFIETEDGKLSKEILEEFIGNFGSEYHTIPKKVYISNTTELGGVYKRDELEDIYDFCKKNDMYLFIDGARSAHALSSEYCDYTLKDLTKLCDITYLGGTKTGFLFGEAMIISNDNLKKDFLNLMKQKGAMLAKGFISGLMWERIFKEEGFYLKGSDHAYQMAKILAKGLKELSYDLAYEFQSNQVFVKVDDKKLKDWTDIAFFETMGKDGYDNIVRLVTTFRTSEEDVKGFLDQLK